MGVNPSQAKTHQIMFVCKDVDTALGYTNTQKAIRDHVDDDDKQTEQFVLSGQARSIIISFAQRLNLTNKTRALPRFRALPSNNTLDLYRTYINNGRGNVPPCPLLIFVKSN